MSDPRPRGPIVIDTDVFSADLVPGSRLAGRYALSAPSAVTPRTVAPKSAR